MDPVDPCYLMDEQYHRTQSSLEMLPLGISIAAQPYRTQLVFMRMWTPSLTLLASPVSCSGGRRPSLDSILLWLWLAAAAPIRPPSCLATSKCQGCGPKKKKKSVDSQTLSHTGWIRTCFLIRSHCRSQPCSSVRRTAPNHVVSLCWFKTRGASSGEHPRTWVPSAFLMTLESNRPPVFLGKSAFFFSFLLLFFFFFLNF